MRSCIALVGLVACGACGRIDFTPATAADATPDAMIAVAPPAVVDGTRLKAWYFANGATQFFGGWTDTLLHVDCAFAMASDGQQRCLPSGWANGSMWEFVISSFSDAACTQPSVSAAYTAVLDGVCQGPPPMYVHTAGVYTTGTSLVTTPYLFTTSCAAFPGLPEFTLATKIDDTMFVAATEQTWGPNRLVIHTLVADDGARQQSAVFDTVLGRTCNLQLRPNGDVACNVSRPDASADRDLALNGLPTKVFADAGCTEPAALADASVTPTVIVDVTTAACGYDTEDEYEVGAEVPAGWAYGDGQCTAISAGWRFYRVGAFRRPVTPLVGHWATTSTDRLRGTISTMDDGTQLASGVWDDTVGAECIPLQDSAAASWRCFAITTDLTEPVHSLADCSDAFTTAYRDCGRTTAQLVATQVAPQPACQAAGFDEGVLQPTANGLYRVTIAGCVGVTEPMLVAGGGVQPVTTFAPLAWVPAPGQ